MKPKTPPTEAEIAYMLHRLSYDPATGNIVRSPSGKPAVLRRSDGFLYVTAGTNRNFPAKDVAWFLKTGDWPPHGATVMLHQKSSPLEIADLRGFNLYLDNPLDVASLADNVLANYQRSVEAYTRYYSLEDFKNVEALTYRNAMDEARLAIRWAFSEIKNAVSYVLPGASTFPSEGQIAKEQRDKLTAHLTNVEQAVYALASAQGWGFPPAEVFARPAYDGEVADWVAFFERVAKASTEEYRNLDQNGVLALLSPLMD